MNAVAAVEQLVAVGRHVQAAEQRLRRPMVALDLLASLGELWADPVARLSALIAPHVAAPPAAAGAARFTAADRFAYQPPSAPVIGAPSYAVPVRGEGSSRRYEPTPTMTTKPAVAPAVPAARSGEAEPERASALAAANAVRLTRNSSSLLAILQSNVRPGVPDNRQWWELPSNSAPEGPRTRDRMATRAGGAREGSHESGAPDHAPQGKDADSAAQVYDRRLQPDWARNDGDTTNGAGEGRVPAEMPVRQDGAGRDLVRRLEQWPGADPGFASKRAPLPTANEVTHLHPVQAAGATPWTATPPASPDPVNWGDPAGAPVALSPAQIDQLLDALDERLEMMMLRMVGAV